jgi:5'-AMP-activated protein kinase regulatory beta subunit
MKNEKRALKPSSVPAGKPPAGSRPRAAAKAVSASRPSKAFAALAEAKVAVKAESPKIRLEFYAPQAREVFVAGSFNNWQKTTTALQLCGPGLWGRDLMLAPGQYEYLFLVDGQWRVDPEAKDYVPNPFGGVNSLMKIV